MSQSLEPVAVAKPPRYIPGDPEKPGFYTFARAVIEWLIAPLLFKLDIQGMEHVPATGPVLLASNHISSFDIIAVALRFRRILHFMAKSEYEKNPITRSIFTRLEAFFVDRGEGDMEAIRNCLAVLKAGQALIIYPEGHRSEDARLQEAKEGFALIAFKSGVPVYPVAVWGSEKVGKGFRLFFWRRTIHLRYGEPLTFQIAGKKATREEMQLATRRTMEAIAAMLPESYRGFYAGATQTAPTTTEVSSRA